jgi:hypothetical protein
MKTVISVIEKSKFDKSNYDPIIQDSFVEFLHRNTSYLRVNTFEKYTFNAPFDHVFATTNEFETWLVYVPPFISKLQAVSHLLDIDRYNDLMTALDSDPTGTKRILFDAAHQLDIDSTMVNEMGVALGFSSDELDNFFVEAHKIFV